MCSTLPTLATSSPASNLTLTDTRIARAPDLRVPMACVNVSGIAHSVWA